MRKIGNKGITIVEVVIAMTIISIISSVAVTIAISSIKSSNKNTLVFNASNTTADIISIYRKSDSKEKFKSLLENTYSVTFDNSDDDTNNTHLSFEYENINYEISWEIDSFDSKITIKASRINNGNKIYETSYSKKGEYYGETQ